MTKLGESLLKGATETLKHAKGEKVKTKSHQFIVPKQVDVKAIRRKLKTAMALVFALLKNGNKAHDNLMWQRELI